MRLITRQYGPWTELAKGDSLRAGQMQRWRPAAGLDIRISSIGNKMSVQVAMNGRKYPLAIAECATKLTDPKSTTVLESPSIESSTLSLNFRWLKR